MLRLLAIDDDAQLLKWYREVLAPDGIEVDTAATALAGVEQFTRCRPDAVLLDVELPDLSGLEAFRRLHAIDAKVPVLFITGGSRTEAAIEAMKLGAYDYLLKPTPSEELRQQLRLAFDVGRLMRVSPALAEEAQPAEAPEAMVGRCRAMQEVYKAIGRVAPQDVTVLIRGESGTGKELVARAIYHHSHRSAGPFLTINCAAIPETLLESELFGHERGAFTGATQQRIGKFEQCSGGTLFLDEVGDMTPATQAKVLRLLQDQRFERVGGTETIHTNVRLLAATNRYLEQMLTAGEFRSDLYYRLNVYAIHLPPLRERREDLPLLVEHFRRRFCRELKKEVGSVAPEALDLLQRYDWPGNIRELQSLLKRAMLQTVGPMVLVPFLPEVLQAVAKTPPAATATGMPASWAQFLEQRLQAGSNHLYEEWQRLTDRQVFEAVLRHTHGNLSQAARILGINRGTLRTKMDGLGLQEGEQRQGS
jgi:two-component system nitrogen regulation response regulator GlnG